MAAASSIIGGLGVATGIGSMIMGGVQGSQARKQQAEAIALQRQKLQFAGQIYKEWQDTFGPINKQLASHYAGLSTQQVIDRYQMAGDSAINDFKAQVTRQNQEMQRTFARQGMKDSGTAAAMSNSLAMDAAEKEAMIRRGTTMAQLNADREVAAEKMNFMSMANQQRGQNLALLGGSFDTLGSSMMSAANSNQQMASNMFGSGLSTALGALGHIQSGIDARTGSSGITSDMNTGLTATASNYYKPDPNNPLNKPKFGLGGFNGN